MKKIITLMFLFLAAVPCFSADKYASMLETAESSFSSGNYKKTIEIYETLIQVEKVNDPNVYYNLSNAYYRNGDLGKAVVNIEKAFLLKPGDSDIKHNKYFLSVQSGVAESDGFEKFMNSITNVVSLNVMTVFVSVTIILILLSGGLFLLSRRKTYKYYIWFLSVIFILSGMLLAVKIKNELCDIKAVSLYNIDVRSGPGINNPEIFNLPEGRIISVLNGSGEWSYIEVMPEGFTGWIESKEIEKIND